MPKETAARAAWTKANTTSVVMKLNNNTDADILAWLDSQPSKQGAIKQLIRDHIKRSDADKYIRSALDKWNNPDSL